MRTAAIRGTGSALPELEISNQAFEAFLDTDDAWIRERTGIVTRRLAVMETTSDLAILAAKRALEDAGADGADVDLILTATSSPDTIFPSVSCRVQAAVGAEHAAAFDVNAACSGFLTALSTAWAYIRCGMAENALVIGAEVMSGLTDWTDRSTCILFGDGAGAVYLEASGTEGIRAVRLWAQGSRGDVLVYRNQLAKHPFVKTTEVDCRDQKAAGVDSSDPKEAEGRHCDPKEAKKAGIRMDGRAVYQFAVSRVPQIIGELLDQEQVLAESVDWFFLHQANERILTSIAKRLHVPQEKFPQNVQRTGNLSAASIPVLLDEWKKAGNGAPGDQIVLAGFGAGLTCAAALLTWK